MAEGLSCVVPAGAAGKVVELSADAARITARSAIAVSTLLPATRAARKSAGLFKGIPKLSFKPESKILLRIGSKSASLNNGTAPITNKLVNSMRQKGRTIHIATKGSDDYKYLISMGAEGSTNTGTPGHILIREDANKSTLIEEFLHGTQTKLGIVKKLTAQGAEIHVKDFMIRHSTMLGLNNPADIRLLAQLKIEEIDRFNIMQQKGILK